MQDLAAASRGNAARFGARYFWEIMPEVNGLYWGTDYFAIEFMKLAHTWMSESMELVDGCVSG